VNFLDRLIRFAVLAFCHQATAAVTAVDVSPWSRERARADVADGLIRSIVLAFCHQAMATVDGLPPRASAIRSRGWIDSFHFTRIRPVWISGRVWLSMLQPRILESGSIGSVKGVTKLSEAVTKESRERPLGILECGGRRSSSTACKDPRKRRLSSPSVSEKHGMLRGELLTSNFVFFRLFVFIFLGGFLGFSCFFRHFVCFRSPSRAAAAHGPQPSPSSRPTNRPPTRGSCGAGACAVTTGPANSAACYAGTYCGAAIGPADQVGCFTSKSCGGVGSHSISSSP
jgi:hypothetical protein